MGVTLSKYREITLEMLYSELKRINQRIATLEHLLIPEEKLSEEELKELDKLVADVKSGNTTEFSKLRK